MSADTVQRRSAQHSRLKVAAWRGATVASRTLARPTSGLRAAPGFLIVGAQRAGTTSLYRYLTQHPAFVSARLTKGVHYFDSHYDEQHGWYLAHFPTRARLRRLSERIDSPTMTGEGSPYYMFHPAIPGRIAEALPNVKLLVVLRDPVSRAWSQYHHEVARGFENLSFEDALAAEASRLHGEEQRLLADASYQSVSHRHHSYVARGRYLPQVQRLHEHFGMDRVHIVDSGSLRDDPQATCDGVADFLGLDHWSLDKVVLHNTRRYDAMSPTTRKRLLLTFEEDNEQLFRYLGKQWSWSRGAASDVPEDAT